MQNKVVKDYVVLNRRFHQDVNFINFRHEEYWCIGNLYSFQKACHLNSLLRKFNQRSDIEQACANSVSRNQDLKFLKTWYLWNLIALSALQFIICFYKSIARRTARAPLAPADNTSEAWSVALYTFLISKVHQISLFFGVIFFYPWIKAISALQHAWIWPIFIIDVHRLLKIVQSATQTYFEFFTSPVYDRLLYAIRYCLWWPWFKRQHKYYLQPSCFPWAENFQACLS